MLMPPYIDIALPKEPEAITSWYDALSSSYDDLYADEQSKKHQKIIETLEGREFEKFVDVGCGTGRLLETISSSARLALGIDLSGQMLIKAKQRLRNHTAQFIRAEASHLPLQDHVADGVVSVSVSEQGPSLTQQFQEFLRIATEHAIVSMTVFSDNNRTLHDRLGKNRMELVAALSDREQLWTRRPYNR